VVSGVAGGMTWMPAIAMSYVGLKHEQISHASPLVAVMMRLGASFGTAVAAILLQLELSRGSAKTHAAHVAWAFRASFVWETVAATIVLLLVAVLLRRSATAPEQHANLADDAVAQPAVLLAEC